MKCPRYGASGAKLDMYRRLSVVLSPVDFLMVSDPNTITVSPSPNFDLSATISRPSWFRGKCDSRTTGEGRHDVLIVAVLLNGTAQLLAVHADCLAPPLRSARYGRSRRRK